MHLQGAHTDPFLEAAAAATQQGAAAGRQLFKPEGLAQHVIGAGIEQGHHGLRAGAGREHHHLAVQLGGEAQGRGLLEQFGAHQQIGGLLLADLQGFAGGGDGRGQVPILTQTLGENGAEGRVGVHYENSPRGSSWISQLVLGHGHLLGITMKSEAEVPTAD